MTSTKAITPHNTIETQFVLPEPQEQKPEARKITFPSAKEISPQVDLQAKRALSIFNALQQIKQEQGEEVFDKKTLGVIKQVEELITLEGNQEPFAISNDSSTELKVKHFDKAKWYQKLMHACSRQFKMVRKVASLFFATPKKIDVNDLLKKIQQHLGIDESGMPKSIKVNNPELLQADAAGYYNSSDDELALLTDGYLFFKTGATQYHPSFKYWFDLLPEAVRDRLTHAYRESGVIELYACHELVHKRQLTNIQKLTASEAKATVNDFVKRLDPELKTVLLEIMAPERKNASSSNLDKILTNIPADGQVKSLLQAVMSLSTNKLSTNDDELLVNLFLKRLPKFPQERTFEITKEELENCKRTLNSWVETLIYSTPKLRATSQGIRRYTANACEIEARMEADAFCIQEDFDTISKSDRITYKNKNKFTTALKYLKNFLVDRAINGMLLRIEEMKAQGLHGEEIAKEENKLETLYKMGGWTATGELLFMEHRFKKADGIKD